MLLRQTPELQDGQLTGFPQLSLRVPQWPAQGEVGTQTQDPFEHCLPEPQMCELPELPHPPQLLLSLDVFTHVPLQPVHPALQHIPLEQFELEHCALLLQVPVVNFALQPRVVLSQY